jgi:hypothetical protein
LLFAFCAASAHAVPANNNFSSATVVPGIPFTDLILTTGATAEANDPAGCGSTSTVWYKFIPASSGAIAVDTLGSTYATKLAAYEGSPGSFTQLACASDTASSDSAIVFSGVAGHTYYILVSGVANATGNLALRLTQPGLDFTSNDEFANRITVTDGSFIDQRDTSEASVESSDPLPSCATGFGEPFKTVWYSVTPPLSGTVTVNTIGSDYDTVLSVFRGKPGAFTEVVCNDDAPGDIGVVSQLSFTADAGKTYHVMASALGDFGGDLHLAISAPFTSAPPNDEFPGIVISALPYNSPTINTTSATTATGDPTPSQCGVGNGVRNKSVWYSFTPASSGTLRATSSGDYATALSVYTGTPGNFTQVACAAGVNAGTPNELQFAAMAGTTYQFMVTALNGTGGNLNFSALTVHRAIGVTPGSLNFGRINVGSHNSRTVELVNNGNVPTEIAADLGVGDFAIEVNLCPNVLEVDETCSIQVAFDPSVFGHRTATLTLQITGSSPVSIPLSGDGDFAISVSRPGRPPRTSGSSGSAGASAYREVTLSTPGYDGPVSVSCESNTADAYCVVSDRIVRASEPVNVGVTLVRRLRASRLGRAAARQAALRVRAAGITRTIAIDF